MRGLIDLHCHWLPAIDDGVKTADDGLALLRALGELGFDHVVATPHIRPGMFDKRAAPLRDLFETTNAFVRAQPAVPQTSLAAEHFFDDVVFGLLMRGEGLPYGKGHAVLLEFNAEVLPLQLHARLFDLRRKRLRPVIAHPERYLPFWKNPHKEAEAMRRAGGVLLLDLGALDGKYGEKSRRTAEALVEADAYYAACSDAHRAEDAGSVARGMRKLAEMRGEEHARTLLTTRPQSILDGRVYDEAYD